MNVELIPFGKENKINKQLLMELSGIKDDRELNREIAKIRKQYIIFSDASNRNKLLEKQRHKRIRKFYKKIR